MAAHSQDQKPPAMDYAEHEKTYALFGELMKWGTAVSVI
ncbi:MAG: aa3-type cytochrome c oxidase subunit IV, partial [Methylobacterium sp.]|nr:aa3-type cytochrome c oxidase subunit IV [Methylobacterium sp.]